MATVIKSDVISTKNLGSLLERIVPKNNLTGFFDFSNDKYSIRGEEVPFSQMFTVNRNSTAQGLNKNKELVTYGINTPRFHLVESVGKYGLALGDNSKNYFLNSNAPATQSITFNEGTERRFFVLVRAKGSGSVTVSGSGITTFTVNGGEEKVVKMTSLSNTINVAVSGTLTYVQVTRVTTPYGVDPTETETTGTKVVKSQDITSVNTSVFASLMNAKNGTVFLKYVTFDGGDLSLTPGSNNTIEVLSAAPIAANGGYVSWLQHTDGTHGKLFIRKQKSGSVLESSTIVDVPINKVNVIAFTMSDKKASVFMNGVFSKLPGVNTETVDPYISNLPFLPSLNNVYIAPNWIVSNMLVYDKVMSDSEIGDIFNMLK